MKKIIPIGLALLSLALLTACGTSSSSQNTTNKSSSNTSGSEQVQSNSNGTTSSTSQASSKNDITQDPATLDPTKDRNPNDYSEISYIQLAKSPEQYKGKQITLSGYVRAVFPPDSQHNAEIYVDTDGSAGDGSSSMAYLEVEPTNFNNNPVQVGDTIVAYGVSWGNTTIHTIDTNKSMLAVAMGTRFYVVTPGS